MGTHSRADRRRAQHPAAGSRDLARAWRPDHGGRGGRHARRLECTAGRTFAVAPARIGPCRRNDWRPACDQRCRSGAAPLRHATRRADRRPPGDDRRQAREGRWQRREERCRVRPRQAGDRFVRQPGRDCQRDVQADAHVRGRWHAARHVQGSCSRRRGGACRSGQSARPRGAGRPRPFRHARRRRGCGRYAGEVCLDVSPSWTRRLRRPHG